MIGIIGAGPSGLITSLMLEGESEVLEKNRNPGGHASSFEIRGFTFDYGPHIMFSKNKPVLDFMVSSLGDNVHRCRRNNKISYKNRLVKFPFENDLQSLPKEDTFKCLKGFVDNPYKKQYPDPKNMREWFLNVFGEGICDCYLFPYNEKVWNVPVENLSMIWADRIPNPPMEDVIKSAIGFETEGYIHQLYYHYPKKGGYEEISRAWAKNCNVKYGFEVKKIVSLSNGFEVYGQDNSKRTYTQLISSMPIDLLIQRVNLDLPKEVFQAVDELVCNPMSIVSLGIKGEDPHQFTAIYFPEKDFPVNRISFPGVFSPQNCPEGHYSIQAEITYRKGDAFEKLSDQEAIDCVKRGLLERGVIQDQSSIVLEHIVRTERSYVVYDREYKKNVKIIRDYFDSVGIHLLGRFGYFEYINVDGAILSAMRLIRKFERHLKSDSDLLNIATQKLI